MPTSCSLFHHSLFHDGTIANHLLPFRSLGTSSNQSDQRCGLPADSPPVERYFASGHSGMGTHSRGAQEGGQESVGELYTVAHRVGRVFDFDNEDPLLFPRRSFSEHQLFTTCDPCINRLAHRTVHGNRGNLWSCYFDGSARCHDVPYCTYSLVLVGITTGTIGYYTNPIHRARVS